MANPLNNLSVDVKAVVVPVLQWGENEYPVHDLLRDQAVAQTATELLRKVLRDLENMQHHVVDAPNEEAMVQLLLRQRDDHAVHASAIREFLKELDR